ncbi:centrosomal protein of 135 kDa-like isoform X2 [Syngnathus scovelli]|uniref:centrosomal protein of 135 kDa-like isoform X2 n=1 Tax=Syngnathus scovelli TaxID=161590 RepID=UPI002110D0F8|nr:centrosomal protein of 135 kDa-like isoform X2 [Syngnathus scovelli]
MDSNKDTKWSKLRARLHMLGYNDNLGEESVQLVEQLFSDLVHTTESLRESQRSTAKSEKESQNTDVRLTRENQELHFELMMVRGERAQVTRELKVYITKLENDVTLLKSLNEQYLHEMHSLEKDCKEKAKLIRQLRRKNVNIWVQAVDRNNLCASPNADDLLHEELTNLKAELENSQESIQHSNNQTLMDELQETNMALEQKLKSAQRKSSSKVIELTSKNHELCQEITDIRNLAKMMEMEKKQKLEKAEWKLQDLKAVIRKLQGVIRELEDQLSKNTMEAYNLREQNEKFEAMLEFLEEENSRLQAKVEKMMSVEKVLVLELEGWRTKYGICGLERSPSRLDAFVQSLEEERDHYRQEVEHYKNIRGRSPVIEAQDSLNMSPKIRNPKDRFKEAENKVQQEVDQVTEDILEEELQQMQEKPAGPSVEIRNLKEQLRLAKEKIAELSEELQGAKENLQCLTSEKDSLGDHLEKAEMDIQMLKSENDELMEELKQKQLQYEEHHSKTSAEMLKLEEKLKEAKDEVQKMKSEKDAQMEEMKLKHDDQQPETSAQIVTLEGKLRLAEEKIQHSTTEKDSLKEELKICQLRHDEEHLKTTAEIKKLEEKLRVAEEKIQRLTAEKDSQKKQLEKRQLKRDEQNSETSEEILKLEEKLRLAEEKIQQLMTEKDSLTKKLELKHDEEHSKTSAETLKLEEKLRLAEGKIQQLTAEKDSLKKELEKHHLKHDEQHTETSEEDVKLEEKVRLGEEKIQQLMAEKDSQKKQLEILQLNQDEQHSNIFAEIVKLEEKLRLAEEKIQQLITEKDSLKKEFEKHQLKHEAQHQETSAETIKLEQKLRLAEEKIQQLITEKDSLKKKDGDPRTSAPVLVQTLRDRSQVAEETIHPVTSDKELKLENPELPSQVLGLRDRERQMDAHYVGLLHNPEETARERIAVSGLRQQQEQIQYALLDLQQMLSVKNNELLTTQSQMEKLKDIIESLSQQIYQHKQEAEVLRISFSALKIRKDVLEEEVVAKTKRLALLQEQLGKKMDVELRSQEKEQAAQRLLETHQEALLQIRRDNELIMGEYRRLQDDVAAMTQEKQVAHEKMEEALREREELKLRVHSYVNTVSRIENILKTKDQENQDLAERFRSDVQEREQRLQQVEGFIGTVRMELLSSETERQHLHEVLGKKMREIQQTYKAQVATLAQETSQLEEEVRVHQEEKVTLLAELVSVREICVKMDAEKEIAARQLLLKSMELERAMTREEDALTEVVLIKEHLASEKLLVRNMEAMLSTNRQEMFQAYQEVSEKEAELKALRHKLALADEKIAAHAREVTNLRRKIDHLKSEMEVLSRKGHERNALEDTPSQDVTFRPLRASSPLDHQPASHQPAPDTSIQEEEVSFGLT